MIDQRTIEEINLLLAQESYEDAIALLEEFIEENPDELTYYWYLGLAYLLQEKAEEAQNIWLSIFLQGNIEEVEHWTTELIEFLETKVQEYITEKKLGNAKIAYEAITLISLDYQNTELLNNLIKSLSYLATNLSYDVHREEAVEVYLEILTLNPDDAISWHSLALNYYYLEQNSQAKEAIQKAIELDHIFPANYQILGLILEKQENYDLAIETYQQAIGQDSKFLDAYLNLANIYLQKQQADKAIEIYKMALDIFPENVFISQNLGLAYKSLGDLIQANLYLGYAEYFSHNHQVALKYFEEFYAVGSGDLNFYLALTKCYLRCDQPNSAIELLEKALSDFPNSISLKRMNQVVLPVVYMRYEDINLYHQRFESLLVKLIEETKTDTSEERQDIIKSLGLITNFHLAYQGKNDIKIQKQYANYIHSITQQMCPQWSQKKDFSLENSKIRVGYISSRLYSLGKLYLNWIKYCDQNKFEIYVYDLSGKDKNKLLYYQKEFELYSNHITFVAKNPELNNLCADIFADQLDILIIPEIGIDPVFDVISCLRLAPVQCTTWAHPVTSGSPNIDYFLSSDLMEPINAQEHYSEKLVRLPNLGFSFPNLIVPTLSKQRSDFELKDDAIVYFCCQSLFKYLPQHDYIFPAIAKHSHSFQFTFLDPAHGKIVTQKFQQRLDKAFGELGLDYRDYCIFLPLFKEEEYLMLNQLTDIFLDGLSWSGGLTTRHALACGLPVVTCPGEMMRARHSYGILQMLGVTETIAKNEAEYIEIAVRLGLDREWRQTIRDKVIANKERIFEDKECIVALEAFFQEVVQKH